MSKTIFKGVLGMLKKTRDKKPLIVFECISVVFDAFMLPQTLGKKNNFRDDF